MLDAAAARAEWGSALPPGVFRGIALHDLQSSICAQVVEASVDEDGEVRVHRVVSAIDAGHVVNPLSVEMQTESAIVFGLTAALYGEITIKHGQVEQSNFHDYPMLRLADMPRVETVIVASEGVLGRGRRNARCLHSLRLYATRFSRRPASASARCRSKTTI